MNNPQSERLMLAAFVQGVVENLDVDLFTNDPGGEPRRMLAVLLSKNGRPGSAQALKLWIQAEAIAYPGDIDNLFSIPVPDNVFQVDQGLRELTVRRRCAAVADQYANLAQFGAEDLESAVGELHDYVMSPISGAQDKDETKDAVAWGRAHIDGEEEGQSGYTSEWSPLIAELLGPMGPSIFMLVAGPPGVGKSAWCAADALDKAQQGSLTVYCSPDMQPKRTLFRFASMLSGVPYVRMWRHSRKKPVLTQLEKDRVHLALDTIENLPLVLSSEREMPDFARMCRRIGAESVYFDFIQQAEVSALGDLGVTERKVSIGVNLLRELTDVAFVCGVSHERPDVGDEPELRFPWSSEPQKLLDIAAFIRRIKDTPLVRFVTKKNRDGPNGEVPYYFYMPLMRMVELKKRPAGIIVPNLH